MAEGKEGIVKDEGMESAYRKWLRQLDEEVPEEVWEGIQDELDLDEVWERVDRDLRSRPATGFIRKWMPRAAAVLLLLALGGAAYWYIEGRRPADALQPHAQLPSLPHKAERDGESLANNNNNKAGLESEGFGQGAEQKAGREERSDALNEGSGLAFAPGTGTPASASAGTEASRGAGTETLPGRTEASPGPGTEASRSAGASPADAAPGGIAATLEPRTAMPWPDIAIAAARTAPGDWKKIAGDEENLASARAPFIRLQEFGLTSAYNNTWLLNHETFNGLQSSTLNSTAASYGGSGAIHAAFLIRGKHKVGAEFLFNSSSSQRYREYIEARYLSRSIELDYSKLQLYYQLPLFSGKADLLLGGYLAYLKSGREEVGQEVRRVSSYYSGSDYGLMTGFQFNLPLNQRLYLHPGFRVSYGLPNIFKGNDLIPGHFLRTHNAALGLSLGIGYRF